MESSECSICFDEIEICCHTFNSPTALFTTKCGHKFHNKCISIWCQTNNSCPICRKKNVYQSQTSSRPNNSNSFIGIINTSFIDNFINLNINIQNNNNNNIDNIDNYIRNTNNNNTFQFNRYILQNLHNN